MLEEHPISDRQKYAGLPKTCSPIVGKGIRVGAIIPPKEVDFIKELAIKTQRSFSGIVASIIHSEVSRRIKTKKV